MGRGVYESIEGLDVIPQIPIASGLTSSPRGDTQKVSIFDEGG
jgi:hypothetical protein